MREVHEVCLVSGGAGPPESVNLYLDDEGRVERTQPAAAQAGRYLLPPLVDLHLDVLAERRRPRATVELGIPETLLNLDAECTGSGVGTVCVAARFEDAPAKGIRVEDAIAVCRAVETLAPLLSADWGVHARVEVTDEGVVEALADALQATHRIKLVSTMEHSFEKSRFASAAEHRRFYAEDWGVSEDEVDSLMARKRDMGVSKEHRRAAVAELARCHGIPLASHDDSSVDEVERSIRLGSTVCEFPLTLQAALHARRAGMTVVLGAPNAMRGRSTSPGNLLVADAVAAGVCSALCSDYLPYSMLAAVFALHDRRAAPLSRIVDMVSGSPAAVIGAGRHRIRVGELLDAVLVVTKDALPVAGAIWRRGRLQMARGGGAPLPGESIVYGLGGVSPGGGSR